MDTSYIRIKPATEKQLDSSVWQGTINIVFSSMYTILLMVLFILPFSALISYLYPCCAPFLWGRTGWDKVGIFDFFTLVTFWFTLITASVLASTLTIAMVKQHLYQEGQKFKTMLQGAFSCLRSLFITTCLHAMVLWVFLLYGLLLFWGFRNSFASTPWLHLSQTMKMLFIPLFILLCHAKESFFTAHAYLFEQKSWSDASLRSEQIHVAEPKKMRYTLLLGLPLFIVPLFLLGAAMWFNDTIENILFSFSNKIVVLTCIHLTFIFFTIAHSLLFYTLRQKTI